MPYINNLTSFLKGHSADENEKNLVLSMLLLCFAAPALRWRELRKQYGGDLRRGLHDALCILNAQGSKYSGLVYPESVWNVFDDSELSGIVDLVERLFTGEDERERPTPPELCAFIMQDLWGCSRRQMDSYRTPRQVAKLMAELLELKEGIVYDPCCGSGNMLVYASEYTRQKKRTCRLYGQEADETAWKIARISLILHGVEASVGDAAASAVADVPGFPDGMKADYVLSSPPFRRNGEALGQMFAGIQWKDGFPRADKGEFVWLQLMLSRLKEDGVIAAIFSNGILASRRREERKIRAALLREDLVEAIFTLPGGSFYTTKVSVSLWILRKRKKETCREKILFADARGMGSAEKGVVVLSDAEQNELIQVYRNFENGISDDRPGFCRQVPITEIEAEEYSFAPERYVMDRRQKPLELKQLKHEEKELEHRLKELMQKNSDHITHILDIGQENANDRGGSISKILPVSGQAVQESCAVADGDV